MTRPKDELSPRQTDVIDFIVASIQEGQVPTYSEIGAALGIRSNNGVADHVKALIKKGFLKNMSRKGTARNLALTSKAIRVRRAQVVEVPILREEATWPLDPSSLSGALRLDFRLVPTGDLVAVPVVKLAGDGVTSFGGYPSRSFAVVRKTDGSPIRSDGLKVLVWSDGRWEATQKITLRAGMTCDVLGEVVLIIWKTC